MIQVEHFAPWKPVNADPWINSKKTAKDFPRNSTPFITSNKLYGFRTTGDPLNRAIESLEIVGGAGNKIKARGKKTAKNSYRIILIFYEAKSP